MVGLNTQIDLNDTVLVENKDYFVALAARLHKSRPETYRKFSYIIMHSHSIICILFESNLAIRTNRPQEDLNIGSKRRRNK